MQEKWLLVCDGRIIATCLASSHRGAVEKIERYVSYIDWAEGDILSEADYMVELKTSSIV